jgi:hypothetical protein
MDKQMTLKTNKERKVMNSKDDVNANKYDYKELIGYSKDDDPECEEFVYTQIIHMTDKAALLKIGGDKFWIPRGQIVDATKDTVVITLWIAKKIGIF